MNSIKSVIEQSGPFICLMKYSPQPPSGQDKIVADNEYTKGRTQHV